MRTRVVVLGGGHGVAAVLCALREYDLSPTVVVTVADDGGSSGALRRRWGGPAVGDMRRSLIALSGEKDGPGRALAAPVTIARFGRHPLGNLVLCSLAKAFGDLETASEWIGGQLGLSACVLPATTQPVTLLAAAGDEIIRGESAVGTARADIDRLRFDPERPEVSPPALAAIRQAHWVLLAPGSLFTSVLAVCALPDVAAALANTRAHVVWICNLEPQAPESAGMSAADHLRSLRRHGVRVDAVLYDPAAKLHFSAAELDGADLPGIAYPLKSLQPRRHEPMLLAAALQDLFSGRRPWWISVPELEPRGSPGGAAVAGTVVGDDLDQNLHAPKPSQQGHDLAREPNPIDVLPTAAEAKATGAEHNRAAVAPRQAQPHSAVAVGTSLGAPQLH
jgi:uncharacterized cofD-like protein